jgi:selenocysteine lyase/cysteine desulfurase
MRPSSNRLDLSRWHPDFVALSFYKMFGWPTGVGALLARREALARLERPWFSGGTVVAAFVQREWYESGELDEEQRVEASEPERLDREEVAGDHRVGVGTDELAPAELRASAGRGHASPP